MNTNVEVFFEAERNGTDWRGLVIDAHTFNVIRRTANYSDADTAKSIAASTWRAICRCNEAIAA